jgi:hypothetical protein
MNCDAYRILISGYIDEELSDNESHRLKLHLKHCGSCLQYLQQQERMQAAIKRYTFVQEAPEVPALFASKIALQLEDGLRQAPSPSFAERLSSRIHAKVLKFVDAWIGSLKLRPFAWTASASFFFLLFSALVMNEMYQQSSPQYLAERKVSINETASLDDISTESLIQFEEPTLAEIDSELDGSDFIVIAELNEGSVPLATPQKSDPVQDYVYSHVVGAYQDRLSEDAMLVGYVQKASFVQ